eukprot:14413223-Alexandrium_andersonii.AAC.1
MINARAEDNNPERAPNELQEGSRCHFAPSASSGAEWAPRELRGPILNLLRALGRHYHHYKSMVVTMARYRCHHAAKQHPEVLT